MDSALVGIGGVYGSVNGGAIMFRKRKRPTPQFKIPSPFNPIQGENANLRQDGTAPYCAMMQVAAEDTYTNYVICRGFDTRILRFIDYAAGDDDKPGISVAKPFGKRRTGTYSIGQVYPALLPTQGNDTFSGFRQVTYVPPSPVDVNWRLGQNPGVVSGGSDGGQPESLSDTIEILYDHNGNVINWLLIDSSGGGEGSRIRFRIVDVVCYGDILDHVVAEWTHYSGGCENPPGADEYGYVDIYDSCVMEYYTVNFLTTGTDGDGATGSATYFYDRDTCEGQWIVDSICGTPECDS